MPVFHESLERMLQGATLRGCVRPASPDASTAAEFRCSIERIEHSGGADEWSIDVVVPADGNEKRLSCGARVRWVDSIPIVSLSGLDLPRVGTIERAEVMFHNGLFAGVWVQAGVRGHVYGSVEPQHQPEHGRKYVIERSGEYLREWWTGKAWSDDSRQARWYEHEPDAPRETGNEGAHPAYYPHGAVEAG